jgi:hypothetical protein
VTGIAAKKREGRAYHAAAKTALAEGRRDDGLELLGKARRAFSESADLGFKWSFRWLMVAIVCQAIALILMVIGALT